MQNDKITPKDGCGASVVRGGGLLELFRLKGTYKASCIGPVEERREEYVALRDEIMTLEARPLPVRWATAHRRRMLRAKLAAIPTEEKWNDVVNNLITDVGANDLLDKYTKGSTYTQTFRMGLAGAGTKAAADTQASHAGWLEVGLANLPTYTGNRKDVTMGSASARSQVSPVQAFAITGSGTVAGCFTNNGGSATKDNTTGVLFSAGDFAGGSKTVSNGDTVNVTYTLSA